MSGCILYHAIDNDGKLGGAICKMEYPYYVLLPANHGWELDWDYIIHTYDHVIMVDFCPNNILKIIDQIEDTTNSIRILDHHKTAIDTLHTWRKQRVGSPTSAHDRVELELSTESSGCQLAWDHFHPATPRPAVVTLVGNYDRWERTEWHGVEDADVLLECGLSLEQTDPRTESGLKLWEDLIVNGGERGFPNHTFATLLQNGGIVKRYRDMENVKRAKRGYVSHYCGLRLLCMNGMGANSMVVDAHPRCAELELDALCLWWWDGSKYCVRLYRASRSEADLSEVCKAHGGGGHVAAGGWECERMPKELR